MNMTKEQIIEALREFVAQRSGIHFADYGDVSAFRADQRKMQQNGRDARELLRAVELSGVNAENLLARLNCGGRLSIVDGRLEYTQVKHFGWNTGAQFARCVRLFCGRKTERFLHGKRRARNQTARQSDASFAHGSGVV